MATKTTNLGLSKAELTDAVRSTLIANNENFDKIDEAYTQLKQENEEESQAIAENAEQIDTLQGQIDRLRANQVQGTASGTEVVVQDSAEMESVLQLSGNSEQDTRSGKNLLNVPETLEFTRLKEIEVDLEAGDYTLFFSNASASDGGSAFLAVFSNASGSVHSSGKDYNKNIVNYSFTQKVTKIALYANVGGYASSAGVTATFEKMMILKGIYTEMQAYEPYGVQPSPDYPSEIRSVKSKSDNLFDKDSTQIYVDAGTSRTIDGTKINITTNGTAGAWAGYWYYIDVKPNTTYTVSVEDISGNDNTKIRIAKNGNGGSEYILGYVDLNSKTFTFTTDSETTKIGMIFYVSEGVKIETPTTVTFDKVQLVKGDKALPYAPYNIYVPVEVKVEGKNLLPYPYIHGTVTTDGITYTDNGDGSYTINGTATANAKVDIAKIKLPRGSYMSHCKGDTIGNTLRAVYKRNGAEVYLGSSEKGQLFAIDDEYTITFYLVILSGVTVNNLRVYPMVESGAIATEYVPYVEPTTVQLPLGDIELRSTPDGTRDTFVRVDGKWNVLAKNNIDLVNINSIVALDNGNVGGVYKPAINMSNKYTEDNILCNRAKTDGRTLKEGTMYKNPLNIILIGNSSDTLETMKAKYDGAEMLYELNTPTYTPITDQALISALDELEQLILHKGYNYITATSVNGVKAQLDLSYYKDINAVLNNLTAMIATIGGELNV